VRLLRASITGEASARGERARELGKQARERINADFDVDNPSTPPRGATSSSQPRHCCEPCQLLQHPRHGTCTARRRRSSNKRPCNRPRARHPTFVSRGTCGTMEARKALRRLFTRAAQWGSPPTKAGCQSGSGSLTRVGMPRTATLAMSSTADGRATQRHGRWQATTHGGVGATTAWGAVKALFCRNIIDACEAREHGGDSKRKHQVEGAIMQAKEWTRTFGRCTRSRSNKVH
jgi:hypothetical protein